MKWNNAEFVHSAAGPEGFVKDQLPQIVFAGRSNVGKSSVINCLLGRNGLARVSGTPGKTACVNYFLIDQKLWFVDLPGYGYAKVSKEEKERWAGLMEAFFTQAEGISLGMLIVDARHTPTKDDVQMASYFQQTGTRFTVLANKCDKLKASAVPEQLNTICQTLVLDKPPLVFSAKVRTGRREALFEISQVME